MNFVKKNEFLKTENVNFVKIGNLKMWILPKMRIMILKRHLAFKMKMKLRKVELYLYEALLHKCRPKAGQNCVFANIANNTFCPQMNREHWGTCTVLIFGFACTFRSLCRRLWRSIHPGGWQWPSIFHKYWQLFWGVHSKYPRGKDTLLSCSIHVRIDTH